MCGQTVMSSELGEQKSLSLKGHGYIIKEETIKMSTVESRVKKVVSNQLDISDPGGELKMNASFVDDLGADSLDTVELVMALEEEFDMEIPDEAAEKIATIQDAIDFIESNLTE